MRNAFSWLLVGFITMAAGAATLPVNADEETQPLLLIESLSPAVPQQESTLRVSGRIANTGDSPIVAPAVQLRHSPPPLASRQEVRDVLTGATIRAGVPVAGTRQEFGDWLQPGQQITFQIRVPVAELALPESGGVFAIFVEALSGEISVASAGTVFPWFPDTAEFEPSQLALLWPITQRPAVAAEKRVVEPQVISDYLPDGRLTKLIATGTGQRVSWLIDSATLQSAQELASGYQIEVRGELTPGEATSAAAATARNLEAILQRNTWSLMPQFAVADVDAISDSELNAVLARSISLPRVIRAESSGDSRATDVFVSGNSRVQPTAISAVADAGTRTAVMPDDLFPPLPALPYTPSGKTTISAGGTPIDVALTDSYLGQYLAGPLRSAAEQSTALQGFLAETALITLERPAEPRVVAAMPPLTWDPPVAWSERLLKRLSRADWIRLTGLKTLLATADPATRQELWSAEQPTKRQLPAAYMDRIGQLQRDLNGLLGIVDNPTGFGEDFQIALQRATSGLWRGKAEKRDVFIDTIDSQLSAERAKVSVITSGTVTLAGDSGALPLTIANDLDRSVTVAVELRSDAGLALDYAAPDPIAIEPRTKAGLEIPIRVLSSQPVQVTVVLTDADGRRYSEDASLEVRSTAASRIAAIIVGAGAVALVLLAGLNLVRRRTKKGSQHDVPA
jgi:hypothetical protein